MRLAVRNDESGTSQSLEPPILFSERIYFRVSDNYPQITVTKQVS